MVTDIPLPLSQLNGDWKVTESLLPVLTVSEWWHFVLWYLLYFKFEIKRYNSQQYMFKTNLQIHKFKEVLEILQHTRLLSFLSPVFAFFSFLNKDRLKTSSGSRDRTGFWQKRKKSKFVHWFLKLQPCEVFDLSVWCRYILYLSYDVKNVVLVTSGAGIYAFE